MRIPFCTGRRFVLLASAALACVLWLQAGPIAAEEAYERFLEGLKEQGLFDVALDYLGLMQTSPLITEGQKQELAFEEGRLLVDNARAENDATAKTKLLDRARDRFADFIKTNPSNPKAATAETELGNVLVERGRSLLDQAARPANATKKDALTKQGRDMLEQAKKVFDEAETKFDARSKEFPKFIDKKKEAAKFDLREQARGDLLRAQMLSAGIVRELARSYPDGSPENKKLMQDAADKYKAIYDKRRKYLVGLMARLQEGNCYQDLGDTKRAIGNYETLLSQPDEGPMHALRTTALHLTLKCLTSDNEKNYESAVQRGDEWLEKALPADSRTPDGLGITYFTALANYRLADTLTNAEDLQRKKALLLAARKQTQWVAKAPSYKNPYRDDAQQLYRKLLGTEGEEQKEPANFAESLDRAKELLDRQQDRLAQVKVAAEMKDEENIPKYKGEAQQFGQEATGYFRRALELRDDETPLDSVNIARYYLCYLDFQGGNYYDSAILGEFVAKNYPKSQGGRQCAKIAMAAYAQTYEAGRKAQLNNEVDRDKMVEIADFITSAWPGGEEADEAWSLLLQISLAADQIDKALEYLQKIPADSPRRGEAELKAGQALWAAYLRAARRDESDRLPQAELDEMFKSASTFLSDGLKRARVGIDAGTVPVTLTVAAAALSLAQIQIESGQAAQAIDLLNDAKLGPLTLVTAGDPVAKLGNFGIDAYKLALRAYVATQALDKAESTMEALDKLVAEGGDANAAGQLTRIYIALGRELEQQLQRLRQEQKADELAAVSKGFELFLDRISSRAKGNTFSSLSWVAETYFSLGSGASPVEAKEPPAEAKAYFDKSLKTDEKIIATATSEKDFATAGAVPAVKLRMARTHRRMRQYKQAYDLLVEVLKGKSNLIDAQSEAARNFQDWGVEKPEYFMKAIAGDVKQKNQEGREENLLWGWAKIAVRTQSQKTSDAFYEARYNQAKCYVELAKKKSGPERTDSLSKAERDIVFTYRLRPRLGGPEWHKKFDTLLRNVQQLQGNSKPTGLPEEASKSAGSVKPVSTGAAK
ncbi:MAG TPA: hypothetical protein VHC22_06195 [Pirellulales bacterium]|nr:hypothetical protein [Pirellulales bacterium]